VGPVRGIVRWAQSGQFGVQFEGPFDLARLAPKKEKPGPNILKPWYIDQRQARSSNS
jgi:hypothetical protein